MKFHMLHRVYLLAGVSYFATAPDVLADPVSLLATAIQGFLLSSTAIAATATGAIATIAANAIVIGGLAAVSLLGGRRGGAIKPSDAKSTFEAADSSVIEGIGRVRVGGMKAFGNTDGSTRWRLVARLQGAIDAIEAYYVGGREVVVDPDGSVTSPPWPKRSGGSWMKIEDKLGTGSETAWSALVTAFPSLWTSAHRVRGIAQSLVTYYNPGLTSGTYLKLYQAGVPDTEWLARASKVYDPRTGLTAWSDNGILACAHVLRRDPAFAFDCFDWDLIAASANKADVLVATKTGTEKRSRVSGMWAWESERGATMQQLMDSAGVVLRMTDAGKIWFDLIDDVPTSEIDFDPVDIVEYSWKSGPEAVERPNVCRLEYYSPERNYDMAEIDLSGIAWARVQDEIDRYGPKYLDIKLPFCPSASQAQRIARRMFALSRADSGVMRTNMVGLAAWGRYYGQITEPDTGDIELISLAAPEIDDEAGLVDIPFAIWPTLSVWNPAVDEADAPDEVPELGYTSDIPQPNAPTAMVQVVYPDTSREFRIGFSLTGTYDLAEANYRTYTSALPNGWTAMTEGTNFAYVAGDLEGVTVDCRVRIFDGEDGSPFSEILNGVVAIDNTAPTMPVASSGGIDAGTLNVSVHGTSLNMVAIRMRKRIYNGILGWGDWFDVVTYAGRPMQDLNFSDSSASQEVQWLLQCLTSDGTEGPGLVYHYTPPAP